MSSYFDQTYNNTIIERANYETCSFENCDFTNYELNGFNFLDCCFTDCNLSNCNFSNSSFKDVKFVGCKMVGADFCQINPFLLKIQFVNCLLNFSFFKSVKLKGSSFNSSDLTSADFTDANLYEVNIVACNLYKAVFDNTDLQKANLKDSYNLAIDPRINKIKGLKVPKSELEGLLLGFRIKTIS